MSEASVNELEFPSVEVMATNVGTHPLHIDGAVVARGSRTTVRGDAAVKQSFIKIRGKKRKNIFKCTLL